MAMFEYRALNAAGQVVTGAMDGASQTEVLKELDRAGFIPVFAREASAGFGQSLLTRLTPEPRPEHVTGFTLDLAMLLKGGVSLEEALRILTQMETRRWLVKLIEALHRELSGGKSFSQTLAAHPRLFPPIYVQTVAIAENSGRLEGALTDIAQERQRNERLKKAFVSAIAYPSFLVVAAIAVLFFVMLYVVPQFEGALEGFRSIAPSTLVVFDLSHTIRDNLDLIVGAAAALLAGSLLLGRLGRGGIFIRLLGRAPLTRTLLRDELTVSFCRTLAILLDNGVPITAALRLIRDVARLPSAAAAIDAVAGDVRQGQRLSDALARRALLPPHVTQMLRVGEEAGKLPDSASRIADFYEARLNATLGRIIAVLGPVMMMAVASLIAWLIVSVMSALISINDLLV